MGTKHNPGKYDCYAKADLDEPLFTLLARDKSAPMLVTMWVCCKCGDIYGLIRVFAQLVAYMSDRQGKPFDIDQCEEVLRCVRQMQDWQETH